MSQKERIMRDTWAVPKETTPTRTVVKNFQNQPLTLSFALQDGKAVLCEVLEGNRSYYSAHKEIFDTVALEAMQANTLH